MSRIHIDCTDFLAEIGNLLEGEIASGLRAQLEAHLAVCKHCTVVYDSTRKTIRILADSETFDLSSAEVRSSTDQIMARIRGLSGGAR